MPFCIKCGNELLPNAKFCHRCGVIVKPITPPAIQKIAKTPSISPSRKSPVVTAYRNIVRPAAWELVTKTGKIEVEHRKRVIRPLEKK